MDLIINANCGQVPERSKPLSGEPDFYLNLLARLNYNLDKPPLADLLRQYKHLEGKWIIVSPIHWQATHNDAMLTAYGEALGITDAIAHVFYAEIAQFFAADNMQLIYHSPTIWLLDITGQPAINSVAVHRMLDQSMMPVLAAFDESMHWQRLLTELQMFLSSHPLNQMKQLNYPINGVWFWGEGVFDGGEKMVFSDDEALVHLFKNGHPLPANPLPKQDDCLLLLNSDSQDWLKELEVALRKRKVQWFWNNTAYQTLRRRWWHLCKNSP